MRGRSRLAAGAGVVVMSGVLALLAGCGTAERTARAPVEDRGVQLPPGSPAPVAVKPPPGAENAGKPGYYSVRPGDTLIKIGQENAVNVRDIVRWNNLENPNLIEVGQVLRVVPPAGAAVASSRTPATMPPLVPPPSGTPETTAVAPPPVTPPPQVAQPSGSEESPGFIWPSAGPLLAGFDEARNKGYDIGGKQGDPVLAAADGRVVYAGAGLRGYGNLIILKHNNTYLTAYAHNQALLVKEDQNVRKGQKIAEMGSTDADRVKLHFEIRRQGKPVDPVRYLGSR
ncbi:MAG: peptidoglycan DD-metalloendopeptidase family protein [Xylophilus ampelinus]